MHHPKVGTMSPRSQLLSVVVAAMRAFKFQQCSHELITLRLRSTRLPIPSSLDLDSPH